ncbi:MAG: DUF1292 domain-containing protein [Ruminococcus sp.]|nr:DUF1292 domain-containing protein [Ruminococcus sp.]
MSEFNDNFDDFDEKQGNYITLTDDDGNEFSLEFIDLIAHKEKEYAVFLPVDEDSEEVVILEIAESDDDEIQEYHSVEDESILNEVFELFKEKYKDDFNFE